MRSVRIEGAEPRVLCFHGTGGDAQDLIPLAQHVAPGCQIHSYEGIIEEHGMLRWFPRRGMNVFDEDEVKEHVSRVLEGLHDEFSDAELRKSVLLGYSNGANAIAAMLALGAPIRRAALLHPMQVLSDTADLSGVKVFVSIGEADSMIPPSESEKLVSSLHEMGASVAVFRSPGGHSISSQEIEAVRAWMQGQRS